jgi:hypothetical protein
MQSYSLPLFSTVDGRCRATASPCSLQWMEDAELQPHLVLYSGWKMQRYSHSLFSIYSGWMIRAIERFFAV